MLEAVLEELDLEPRAQVAVVVNGLGATPPEELYILYRRIHRGLASRQIEVHRAYVGEYATSLEMAGASLSVIHLNERLCVLLDMPAESPFFVQTEVVAAAHRGDRQ
jgi:dihydroxyacetone kinase